MLNDKCQGFTLFELLAVLTILLFLGFMVVESYEGIDEEASVITALNEMDAIKKAIREGFYLDLGIIPQFSSNPEYATMRLCLRKDCTDVEIEDAKIAGNCDGLPEECNWMCTFLCDPDDGFGKDMDLLIWDKYYRKGWRGPYMEHDATCNLFDSGFYSPLIATPWADRCEEMAKKVEEKDPDKAAEYRKGKYYHIIVDMDWTDPDNPKQYKDTARIVCLGVNGLPGKGGTGNFWASTLDISNPDWLKELEHLKITDPDDDNYVDIDDDIVMFIFGGGPVRSPLEK